MEELFLEFESSFEGAMQHINKCLEFAILKNTEDLLTNSYVTEAVKESMWSTLKDFFTKIVLSIKNFIKEVQIKIEYTIKEKQLQTKLNELYKSLKENHEQGKRSVEIVDYWYMKKIFKKYYNDLTSYAKKFSNVKYTKTWQIEDDLDKFNALIDKYNSDLEKASNKKIKLSIKKALDFVEDEIRGKSEILQSINDYIKDISEIEQLADNLKTRMDILGAAVIPKHVGFIQRMVNKITGFIRKWTIKIIMGIVFLFAY